MISLADPELARLVLQSISGYPLGAAERNRVRIAASIALQPSNELQFLSMGEGRFQVGRKGRMKGFRVGRSDGQAAMRALHAIVALGGAKTAGLAKTTGATRKRLERAAAAVGGHDAELGRELRAGIWVGDGNLMAFVEGTTPIRVG